MASARRRLARRYPGILAPGDGYVLIGGSLALLATIGGFWAYATAVSPDQWVPVLVFVGLMTVSAPIVYWLSPRDTRLRRLLILGLVLKLFAVFPRYLVNEVTYEGNSDAGQYHRAGQVFYQNVHEEGSWSLDGSTIDAYSDETRIIGYITGLVYLAVGTSEMGGYLAFSWVCWFGLVCFYRSFRVAYPNAPPRLAALLIFFLPSMLYWPSSLGKDAVMVAGLGLFTLGIARLVTSSKPLLGLAYLVPSAALVLAIRPHLLLVALIGVGASMVARNASGSRTGAASTARVVLLLALIPLLLVGMTRVDDLFGSVQDGNNFTVTEALDRTGDQTSVGGSAFETRPINSLLDVPVAVVSVLYRPFPFEVSSIAVLISSLESTFLLVMTFAAGRWIWRVVPAMYRHPFSAFCGGYVLAFIFAFSNIGNAGILARQRVQMFPVLMLLVAAAREHHRVAVELSKASETEPDRPVLLADA